LMKRKNKSKVELISDADSSFDGENKKNAINKTIFSIFNNMCSAPRKNKNKCETNENSNSNLNLQDVPLNFNDSRDGTDHKLSNDKVDNPKEKDTCLIF